MSDDLKPGWLGRDIARASARVTEWKEEKMGDNLKERLKNAPHEITKLALDRINLLEDAMRGATIVANASTARIAELEAQVSETRLSLALFTAHYEPWMDGHEAAAECIVHSRHTFGDLRHARALLAPKPTATGETP